MPANLRQLGKNGVRLPALGLGLMGMGSQIYGPTLAEEERFALLDRAHELGETFWDTSDMYGESEETIGKWFKRTGKRNDIFLATKFGYIKGSATFEVDSSAEYCKKCCDESLKILGVDSIDLYFIHAINPKTPIEETMRAMAELKTEGKIRYIGVSNVGSTDLRRAVKIAPVAAAQVEYSAFARDIEGLTGTDLLATCRELGVSVIAYSPLGRGLLTSTFAKGQAISDSSDSRTSFFPRFQEENLENNIRLIKQFTLLADKKSCSVTQLAIAWLLKQGDDIFPIPGTKRTKNLEENWGALNVILTNEEEAEIRRFIESAEVAGGIIAPELVDNLWATTVEES